MTECDRTTLNNGLRIQLVDDIVGKEAEFCFDEGLKEFCLHLAGGAESLLAQDRVRSLVTRRDCPDAALRALRERAATSGVALPDPGSGVPKTSQLRRNHGPITIR